MEKDSNGEETAFSGRAAAEELLRSRAENEPRPQDTIESFETAQGSVYTYDNEGRTTRFKTITGEQDEPQDLTVFAELSLQQEQDVLAAYRTTNPSQKTKVYVVERQPDDQPKILRNLGDIQRSDQLFLAIYRDDRLVENKPASLFPQIGWNVFDTRHFQEEGVMKTERHLGNKVTKINYK